MSKPGHDPDLPPTHGRTTQRLSYSRRDKVDIGYRGRFRRWRCGNCIMGTATQRLARRRRSRSPPLDCTLSSIRCRSLTLTGDMSGWVSLQKLRGFMRAAGITHAGRRRVEVALTLCRMFAERPATGEDKSLYYLRRETPQAVTEWNASATYTIDRLATIHHLQLAAKPGNRVSFEQRHSSVSGNDLDTASSISVLGAYTIA